MFGLATFRLQERGSSEPGFDVLDPDCGAVVGVARPCFAEAARKESAPTPPAAPAGPVAYRPWWVVAPFLLLGLLVGLISGKGSLVSPPSSRPRLILRRLDGGVILTLRVSSGLLYDSRVVYDGQGRLIAQFRSRGKSTVGDGFGIIDLRGCVDGVRDNNERPWLGYVEPSGASYRVRLVNDLDAGRITPRAAVPDNEPPGTMARTNVDHHDLDASPASRTDSTTEILLLAAALTIAWSGR